MYTFYPCFHMAHRCFYIISNNLFILRNTIRDCSDITGSRVRLLQKRTLVSHDFPNYYQTDYNCMHYLGKYNVGLFALLTVSPFRVSLELANNVDGGVTHQRCDPSFSKIRFVNCECNTTH